MSTSSAPRGSCSPAPPWRCSRRPRRAISALHPRHAPLLTLLKPGEVRVQTPDGQEHHFFVGGGALEVQPTKVTVLADTALRAKDIDEAAALAAKQRAEEALRDKAGHITLAEAQAELARAIAQLKAPRAPAQTPGLSTGTGRPATRPARCGTGAAGSGAPGLLRGAGAQPRRGTCAPRAAPALAAALHRQLRPGGGRLLASRCSSGRCSTSCTPKLTRRSPSTDSSAGPATCCSALTACALIARAQSRDAPTRSLLVPALAVAPFVLAIFWLASDVRWVVQRPIAATVVGLLYLALLSVRLVGAAFGPLRLRPALVALLLILASPWIHRFPEPRHPAVGGRGGGAGPGAGHGGVR